MEISEDIARKVKARWRHDLINILRCVRCGNGGRQWVIT